MYGNGKYILDKSQIKREFYNKYRRMTEINTSINKLIEDNPIVKIIPDKTDSSDKLTLNNLIPRKRGRPNKNSETLRKYMKKNTEEYIHKINDIPGDNTLINNDKDNNYSTEIPPSRPNTPTDGENLKNPENKETPTNEELTVNNPTEINLMEGNKEGDKDDKIKNMINVCKKYLNDPAPKNIIDSYNILKFVSSIDNVYCKMSVFKRCDNTVCKNDVYCSSCKELMTKELDNFRSREKPIVKAEINRTLYDFIYSANTYEEKEIALKIMATFTNIVQTRKICGLSIRGTFCQNQIAYTKSICDECQEFYTKEMGKVLKK